MMNLKLSMKTVFRTPLKTLLTFWLLAIATFMLVYNLSDYALTARERQQAVDSYQGVFSVEPSNTAALAAPWGPFFLLSDTTNLANYDNAFPHAAYHQQSLSQAEIDALAALPYVTGCSPRYMTAGVSDAYYRTDRQGYGAYWENIFYNYSARFVIEATLDRIDYYPKHYTYALGSITADARNLYLSDIQLLAGKPEWLDIVDDMVSNGQMRVVVYTPRSDFYDRVPYLEVVTSGSLRRLIICRNNHYSDAELQSLVPGQRYIITGRVEPRNYQTRTYDSTRNDSPSFYIGDDTLYNWWSYIYPLEGQPDNYLELDEFASLRDLIQVTNDDLHTFDVVYSDDMSTIKRVADGKLALTQGRLLTSEDTQSKNPVCVVSDTFLREYGLEPGDTISLRLGDKLFEQYAPLGAVASTQGRYADSFTDKIDFEIVGSYMELNADKLHEKELYWAYSENTIFIPLSYLPAGPSIVDAHEFKPSEISFVIGDARNIRAFIDECLPQIQDMGLNVYFSDGGWLAVEQQLSKSGVISLSKLIVFIFAASLATALTVYLFIGRKKREFAIMRALGTTRCRACQALFVPFILFSVPAVLLGGTAAAYYAARTSDRSLQELTSLGLQVSTNIPLSIILIGILGEPVLLACMAAFGLAHLARRSPLVLLQDSVSRNAKSKKPGKPEHRQAARPGPDTLWTAGTAGTLLPVPPPQSVRHCACRHILRFAMRHSRRALARSSLSLILAALLFGAIGQLTTTRQAYDVLYHNIEVRARFVNGFPSSRAKKVEQSGYVRDPYYEYTYTTGEANFQLARLCLTSDIRRMIGAPIYLLDGYDLAGVMTLREKVCIITDSLMETLGLRLGDTVKLNMFNYLGFLKTNYPNKTEAELMSMYNSRTARCKIVGCIQGDTTAYVYLPMEARELFLSLFPTMNLDLAEYTLNDYHQADEFREFAKEMIDISGTVSTPIFLMDTSEADNIYMIYRLIETLYPIAAVAAILIGGLLPALIILQSAREASILRVLGTTKKRTRALLILEQLFLCLLGLLLAFLLLLALNGSGLLTLAAPLTLYAALHFAACLLGTSLAAISVSRRNILELLQVKE